MCHGSKSLACHKRTENETQAVPQRDGKTAGKSGAGSRQKARACQPGHMQKDGDRKGAAIKTSVEQERVRTRAAVRLERRRNLIKEKIDFIRECISPQDTPQTMSQASTLQLAARFIMENEGVLQEFKEAVWDGMPERAMGDLLLMLDKDGCIVLAVTTCVDHLQEEPEELKGRLLVDYVHEEDRDRVSAVLRSMQKTSRFHCKFKLKNSCVYQYDVMMQTVSFRGRDCVMVSAMREFKCHQLEGDTVEGEGKDSSYVAMCICLPGGVVLWSRSAHRNGLILGYEVPEFCGQSIYAGIHPADIHSVANMHKVTVNMNQSALVYYRIQAKGGAWAAVDALVVPCSTNQHGWTQYLVMEMHIKKACTLASVPAPLKRLVVQCCTPILPESLEGLLAKCQGLLDGARRSGEEDGGELKDKAMSLGDHSQSGSLSSRLVKFRLIPAFGLASERTPMSTSRRPVGLASLIVPPPPLLTNHITSLHGAEGQTPSTPTSAPLSACSLPSLQSLSLSEGSIGTPRAPISTRQYGTHGAVGHALSKLQYAHPFLRSHSSAVVDGPPTTAPLTVPQLQEQLQLLQSDALGGGLRLSPRRRYTLSQVSPRGSMGRQLRTNHLWDFETRLAKQKGALAVSGASLPEVDKQGTPSRRPTSLLPNTVTASSVGGIQRQSQLAATAASHGAAHVAPISLAVTPPSYNVMALGTVGAGGPVPTAPMPSITPILNPGGATAMSGAQADGDVNMAAVEAAGGPGGGAPSMQGLASSAWDLSLSLWDRPGIADLSISADQSELAGPFAVGGSRHDAGAPLADQSDALKLDILAAWEKGQFAAAQLGPCLATDTQTCNYGVQDMGAR